MSRRRQEPRAIGPAAPLVCAVYNSENYEVGRLETEFRLYDDNTYRRDDGTVVVTAHRLFEPLFDE